MNTTQLFFVGWSWNPLVLTGAAAAMMAAAVYDRRRWRENVAHGPPVQGTEACRMRWGYFCAAVVLVLLTLCSPLNALATGVLFSAHMIQHILLLLIVPGLLVLSLPQRGAVSPDRTPRGARWRWRATMPAAGWASGVGAMWFWHVPQLCDAAASHASVHACQTLSLLALGTAFWWPILAPRERDRLLPGFGVLYLFTACLACTALGILLTLTPVEVCPIFRAPLATGARGWTSLRAELGPDRDRQLGGLLMWVPMCFVYMAAILFELARWYRSSCDSRAIPDEVRP